MQSNLVYEFEQKSFPTFFVRRVATFVNNVKTIVPLSLEWVPGRRLVKKSDREDGQIIGKK